jgi:3D (Asp-Asp-Asp) domain-containing protein
MKLLKHCLIGVLLAIIMVARAVEPGSFKPLKEDFYFSLDELFRPSFSAELKKENKLLKTRTMILRRNNLSSRSNKRLRMIVTAYCSCADCCGKSDGITASGTKAHWGTVAAPRWLPFGTKLKIEGFDTVFTVEDRGGAIKGNRLDIWYISHEQAKKFGRKALFVEILEWGGAKK